MAKIIIKFYIITVITFVIFLWGENSVVYAETLDLTCNTPTTTANWPRNVYTFSCAMRASQLNKKNSYDFAVQTDNYTTTKVSGNGSDITYTSPEHRITVDGPDQGGIPVNLTTSQTIIESDITNTRSANLTVTFYYTTYEADMGGTTYSQNITATLIRDGSPITTTYGSLDFTIEDKQYISISASPSITLTSLQTQTLNEEIDSNTVNVNIKANNAWTLQTKLDANLASGGNNIPVSSNYFRASGTGFNNLASTKTQFALANTYYDIAENSTGVYTTGSSDGINLNSIDVSLIYNLKVTDLFLKGIYTTNTGLNLISP